MKFQPRVKEEVETKESYNMSLRLSLKKELFALRADAERKGYDWNATIDDLMAQFVEEFKTELKGRGKTQDKSQGKPPGEVVSLVNGQGVER